MTLPLRPDAVAPDGSDVRLLLAVAGGGLAHFELGAVRRRSPSSIGRSRRSGTSCGGRGRCGGRSPEQEEVVRVSAGVCITIPLGTRFQFRSLGDEPLAAVGVTIPRWPGDTEAMLVDGPWQPTANG